MSYDQNFGQVIQGRGPQREARADLRFLTVAHMPPPAGMRSNVVYVTHRNSPSLLIDETEWDGDVAIWRGQDLEMRAKCGVKPLLYHPAANDNVVERQAALIGHIAFSLSAALGPKVLDMQIRCDDSFDGLLAVLVAYHFRSVIPISGFLSAQVLKIALDFGVYVGTERIA